MDDPPFFPKKKNIYSISIKRTLVPPAQELDHDDSVPRSLLHLVLCEQFFPVHSSRRCVSEGAFYLLKRHATRFNIGHLPAGDNRSRDRINNRAMARHYCRYSDRQQLRPCCYQQSVSNVGKTVSHFFWMHLKSWCNPNGEDEKELGFIWIRVKCPFSLRHKRRQFIERFTEEDGVLAQCFWRFNQDTICNPYSYSTLKNAEKSAGFYSYRWQHSTKWCYESTYYSSLQLHSFWLVFVSVFVFPDENLLNYL